MSCIALKWKKGNLHQCELKAKENNLCKCHKYFQIEWLDREKFTICKRCCRGFITNGKKRCDKCNTKSNKPKNISCQFMTKQNIQCTNQSQENTEYCRLHIPYIENGVNPDGSNRCNDCGNPHNRDVNKCQECQNKRSKHQTKKRNILNEIHINKDFPEIIRPWEISPYYVGGFFDGDGSIYIDPNNCLSICLTQCYLPILQKFNKIFGGKLYIVTEKRNEQSRYCHSLKINGTECLKLLQYLDIGCILKYEQIQIAKKFIFLNKIHNLEENKKKYRQEIKKLNKKYKSSENLEYSKINWEYLSGLFDAEGCIFMNKKCKFSYIKITQKNNWKLIQEIRNFTGHGQIGDKIIWKVNKIDFAKWDLNKMLPFLNVKKYQAECCLKYFSATNQQEANFYVNEIKKDKHRDYLPL